MNQKVKDRWVRALRSDVYRQGKECLRTTKDEFCCLGVLCDLAEQEGIGQWNTDFHPNFHAFNVGEDYKAGTITVAVKNWSGLKAITPLIGMNDSGVPFSEIANYIEENY